MRDRYFAIAYHICAIFGATCMLLFLLFGLWNVWRWLT